MNPACNGNAYSVGGPDYRFTATPAYRLRPDIGFQPWRRPDGKTATTAECGREVTGSFWLCQSNDAAVPTTGTTSYRTKDDNHPKTRWIFTTVGNYTENIQKDSYQHITSRGRYRHYFYIACDRLMFAQNCHYDPDTENLVVPDNPAPIWMAPRRAAATDISAARRARRPFNSPESSKEGFSGTIWTSKQYADWRLQPKEPKLVIQGASWDKRRYLPAGGVSLDEAFRDCVLAGLTTEEIGIMFGYTWDVWDTELLYTVAGKEDDQGRPNFWPIYWCSGGTVPENYTASRLLSGLMGNCDWGDEVPSFMVDGNAGNDMMAAIDPELAGIEFDLCVLFRTYHYKTIDTQGPDAPTDVATGYFNTKCVARARIVAPCYPA